MELNLNARAKDEGREKQRPLRMVSLSLSLCGAFDRVARIMQLEREVAFVVRAKVKHVVHKRGDRIGKKGR